MQRVFKRWQYCTHHPSLLLEISAELVLRQQKFPRFFRPPFCPLFRFSFVILNSNYATGPLKNMLKAHTYQSQGKGYIIGSPKIPKWGRNFPNSPTQRHFPLFGNIPQCPALHGLTHVQQQTLSDC